MKASWLVLSTMVVISSNASAGERTDTTTWTIDPAHTGAHFSVRHLMVSNVRGELSAVSGKIVLNEKDPSQSTIEAKIPVSTLNTREPKRDEHLMSPDFLDAAKFPNITFKSTGVRKTGKDKLAVKGELTMHGVTKPVELKVELSDVAKDPWGGVRRGAVATTKLNRRDFGLTWNKSLETGGVLVGDEVTIVIDVEATQVADKVAAAK